MRNFLILVVLILVSVGMSFAQHRVGYMNPQEVLDNLPVKESIERQLDRFLDEKEAEFEEKVRNFQNKLREFQEQAPELSEAENRRRQQELQVLDQELNEFERRVQMELEQRQNQLLGPVLQEMNAIIESIAVEIGLDFVLNEATSEGELFLMYVSGEGREQLNLTEKVLSRMLNQ